MSTAISSRSSVGYYLLGYLHGPYHYTITCCSLSTWISSDCYSSSCKINHCKPVNVDIRLPNMVSKSKSWSSIKVGLSYNQDKQIHLVHCTKKNVHVDIILYDTHTWITVDLRIFHALLKCWQLIPWSLAIAANNNYRNWKYSYMSEAYTCCVYTVDTLSMLITIDYLALYANVKCGCPHFQVYRLFPL